MQEPTVLQRPLLHHTPIRLRNKGGAGRAEVRPASPRPDPHAFLNTKIDEIIVSDTDMLDVALEKGYREFVDGLRRFYRMAHRKFKAPQKGNIASRICELIERTEEDLSEIGLELCVWKHEDDNELNFTVYRHVGIMDELVYIFYLSPCDTLKGEISDIYKRYVRYIGDCFGSDITPDGSCNYYIDMILNMMFDDVIDEDDYRNERKLLDFYNNGHGHKLFNEVNGLIVNPDELRRDLEVFRKSAKGDELTLVEVMLEGMDVLPYMSMERYDFNPVRDGFETNDGCIETCSSLAFTYCHNDGLEDLIIDSINNDCNCGLYAVGWNKWLHLENFTKEDFDFVMGDNSKQREFVEWTHKWYNIERRFDKTWD